MPRLSEKKRTKISEQILYYLFSCAPESKFTSEIAEEIVRDEEFIKDLLKRLHDKKLVVLVSQNSAGVAYQKRQRWRLSNQAYSVYAEKQASLVKRPVHIPDEQ
jgi:predicted transcriptional regulator with HTH domain